MKNFNDLLALAQALTALDTAAWLELPLISLESSAQTALLRPCIGRERS